MNDYLKSLNRKRMGAGAVFQDNQGRILLLKPSYKDYWTVPGGAVEKDESPREACEREVEEEIGLKKQMKRLVLVDYLSAKGEVDESLQWIFDGGVLTSKDTSRINTDGKEIIDHKFVPLGEAVKMLGSKLARRLSGYKAAFASGKVTYMEDGLEVF